MTKITVGVYEAKSRLSALVDQVTKGNRITITRHGRPVAMIVPVDEPPQMTAGEAFAALRELRKGKRLNRLTIRELIEEGRRF